MTFDSRLYSRIELRRRARRLLAEDILFEWNSFASCVLLTSSPPLQRYRVPLKLTSPILPILCTILSGRHVLCVLVQVRRYSYEDRRCRNNDQCRSFRERSRRNAAVSG